jgi:hypothetical protein
MVGAGGFERAALEADRTLKKELSSFWGGGALDLADIGRADPPAPTAKAVAPL